MKKWLYFMLPLGGGIIGGTIAALWGATLHQQDKFSVFVALLTILLAILTAGGYGAYTLATRGLERRVERWESDFEKKMEQRETKFHKETKDEENRIRKRMEQSQNLFMARLQRGIGYMFWELFRVEELRQESSRSSRDSIRERLVRKLLELAIDRARVSCDYTSKLPEAEYREEITDCKNNLAYFLADAIKIKELTKQDKEQALKLAKDILDEASKEKYPKEYYEREYYKWKETSAWVLWHLAEPEDVASKQKARDLISGLKKDSFIPALWRQEITEKWKGLGVNDDR